MTAPPGGAGRAAAGLAERVDHDHQVGRPGGGPLVHVQLAAADAHRPVHVPQPVTGHVRADPGELNSLADGAAGVFADPAQQFGQDRPGPHPGRLGEDFQPVRRHQHGGLEAAQAGPAGHLDHAR